MDPLKPLRVAVPRNGRRRLPEVLAVTLALLGFGGAVLWGRLRLGAQMRAQILQRDAVILQTLARREAAEAASRDPTFDPADPASQYAVLLGMADLTNIIAARLFDAAGHFVAGVPLEVKEATLGEATLACLQTLEPLVRFRVGASRSELFLHLPNLEAPRADTLTWVEVYIPFAAPNTPTLLGVGQFMLEGYSLGREFARLDARLNRQAALLFLAGTGVIGGMLGGAFRRLERLNRALAERSAALERANQALAQAARSAALGAVTAHLVHSLKNPVAGLQAFVAAQQDNAPPGAHQDWREALAATRRMQQLIHDAVQVLREQESGPAGEVSAAELAETVLAPIRAAARARGVTLEACSIGTALLDRRVAGLVRLILTNLVQNGLEVTPAGGRVELGMQADATAWVWEVRDSGGGVPVAVRDRLFQPVPSTKEGGSGIGLAISNQLARHLGAELTLAETSPAGSVFRLRLPRGTG